MADRTVDWIISNDPNQSIHTTRFYSGITRQEAIREYGQEFPQFETFTIFEVGAHYNIKVIQVTEYVTQ
jgi:hypothetical protein